MDLMDKSGKKCLSELNLTSYYYNSIHSKMLRK